jgi:hypothetical protein
MVKKQRAPKSQPRIWMTEHLRLTAFPQDTDHSHEEVTWEKLIGTPPETRQQRPHDRATLEAGELDSGWLTLEVSPPRINWRLMAKPSTDVPPSGIAEIGTFRDTRETFFHLMNRWLRTSPPLTRLAFGAKLWTSVADRQDGYKELDRLLPGIQIDSEGMSDFFYRVNRRRFSGSGIEGLKINRLSTWYFASMSILTVHVSPGVKQVHETGELGNACMLELDINTDPEFAKRLTKRIVPKLLQELVDLGVEISEHGDQP